MQEEMCGAVRAGDIEAVRRLLAHGCSVHHSVEHKVDADHDPFLLAACWRQEPILELFFKHNASTSRSSSAIGNTALHLISFKPEGCKEPVDESLVGLLLRYGVLLEARNNAGLTPLIASVLKGELSIAKCLLDRGASIQARTKNGWTSLHIAAHRDNPALVELLISRGAPLEAREKDRSRTPLHMTTDSKQSSIHCANLLLEAGADIGAVDANGHQALHLASSFGNINVLGHLIAFGADVNAPNGGHLCALHYAKYRGHPQVVELLLQKGADPLAVTADSKRTPLEVGWHEGREDLAAPSEEDKKRCVMLLEQAERAAKQGQASGVKRWWKTR